MVDQWITANAARALIAEQSDEHSAEMALILRAHAGLIRTRSHQIDMGNGPIAPGPIPVEFWWPDGMRSLVQNWAIGDMWNRLKGQDSRAYGVQFELEGIKQMLPAPRAAAVARQMSVAGDPDWVTALAAQAFMYGELRAQPGIAGRLLIDQCRLGFVAARAVLMQRADGQHGDHWVSEAREWDVPVWFWEGFTSQGSSSQIWELGTFAGRGLAPTGRCSITLTGVYFARSSLAAMLPAVAKPTAPALSAVTGGRLPAAFWDDLWCAVWGEVHRGDLKPKLLADVERAMMQWITNNGHTAAESVVRERARKMLAEYEREDGNHSPT